MRDLAAAQTDHYAFRFQFTFAFAGNLAVLQLKTFFRKIIMLFYSVSHGRNKIVINCKRVQVRRKLADTLADCANTNTN